MVTVAMTFEQALVSLREEWRRASPEERVLIEQDAQAVRLLDLMLGAQ